MPDSFGCLGVPADEQISHLSFHQLFALNFPNEFASNYAGARLSKISSYAYIQRNEETEAQGVSLKTERGQPRSSLHQTRLGSGPSDQFLGQTPPRIFAFGATARTRARIPPKSLVRRCRRVSRAERTS